MIRMWKGFGRYKYIAYCNDCKTGVRRRTKISLIKWVNNHNH